LIALIAVVCRPLLAIACRPRGVHRACLAEAAIEIS
jgi:hypothetical protein